ncbi:MAG: cellulase family glycosylhydrolase [Treponemataceae bacterium]
MRIQGGRITDDAGRTLILRGCNLGGDSKYPALPDGATHLPESLRDPASVSFVGRPFPAEEADAHFALLSSWGFLFLRFVITWEAVEHSGPGIYDESFLAYVRKILKKAEEYGISVFMDCHQDVWSRWSGGDGAPAWTLEKLGMKIDRMDISGAAVTHQAMAAAYPRMIWATNYNRYAAATMFTLFFAGNEYAPGVLIDGESAQDYLQSKYIAAMRHAYRRLKDCRAIVGWGPMNEPHAGFIGYKDLSALENCALPLGVMPTAFQSMAAASGFSQTAPAYSLGLIGVKKTGNAMLNADKESLFRDGFECPWKRAGVWTDEGGMPRLLRPDHFTLCEGRPAHFADDFLKPFQKHFAAVLREVRPEALMFIEGAPHLSHPSWTKDDGEGFVNAFHWYDGATLVTKRYAPFFSVRSDTRKPVFGKKAVARSFSQQLSAGIRWSVDRMVGMPSFLGEFGLPFDLNDKKAYRTGDFSTHEEALSSYYDAVDENLLHSTIWNYSASNSNKAGDGWNGEDLSIWSRDGGGPRAIDGWRRPYPIATAGIPLLLRWDRKAHRFEYRFRADPTIDAPTEIYAPAACFGEAPRIRVTPENAAVVEVDAVASRVKIRFAAYEGEAAVIIEKS